MQQQVVTIEEVDARRGELALSEAESARRAARLAEQAAEEAVAMSKEDLEIASEWAKASRLLAGLAFGHSVKAVHASSGSPAARAARDAASLAAGHAHAAESACRRD